MNHNAEYYQKQYIQYGGELNDCTNAEDVKTHNQAMRELSKLYSQAKNENDKSFYLDLIKYPNPRVRRIAAAHCLGMNVYRFRAIRALKAIIRESENKHDVFTAKSIIEVWKKNRHKLSF